MLFLRYADSKVIWNKLYNLLPKTCLIYNFIHKIYKLSHIYFPVHHISTPNLQIKSVLYHIMPQTDSYLIIKQPNFQ